MDSLLHRYRSLTVLVAVILAQLVLLAYQVKTNQDTRLIRVWAVTAVTPLARVLEGIRANTVGFFDNYIVLSGVQADNRRMKEELGKLKLENQFLKEELATAQRAEALQAFRKQSQSQMLAARVIGTSTGTNSKVVFIDRGSTAGVQRGMAVVTPDGIVGKVIASYPTASQVQLITDPAFAAGVVSQKNKVIGTLKGQGRSDCIVDYVQVEQNVDPGERFYTSGDDRVFPKGLAVGQVTVVRQGRAFKEIYLTPSGFQHGIDEVLVVTEGAHQQIPEDTAAVSGPIKMLPAPSGELANAPAATGASSLATDADRMREKYRGIGSSQGHKFGEGMTSPNFNKTPAPPAKPATGVPASQPPLGSAAQTPASVTQSPVVAPKPAVPATGSPASAKPIAPAQPPSAAPPKTQ